MKRIIAIALFALAGLVTINSASAQDRAVQATIPFAFAVGSKVLPSGTYTITQVSSGVVEIENRTIHASALSVVIPDSRTTENGGKLVFDKYGDQYFLNEILCPNAAMNVSLPPSKLEKQVKMQEAKLQGSDRVLVAAR